MLRLLSSPEPASISYLLQAPLLEKRFVSFFFFMSILTPNLSSTYGIRFNTLSQNIRRYKERIYFIFQLSTVVGHRGLRGHRVVKTAAIIEQELVRLRVHRTVDGTVWAETLCLAIVLEDLVSVCKITLKINFL